MVFIGDVYDGKENDWMWPCFVFVCVICVLCMLSKLLFFFVCFVPICNFGAVRVCVGVSIWIGCSYTLETQRLLHHFHWEWAYALQTVQHYANSVCFHKIRTLTQTHSDTHKNTQQGQRKTQSVNPWYTVYYSHIHTYNKTPAPARASKKHLPMYFAAVWHGQFSLRW